jgi:hypothetical protein
MPIRALLLLLLLLVGGSLVFGQSRVRDWTKSQPPPPPMDLRTLHVPKGRMSEAERMLEADFARRIDQVAKEWNRWLDMRREQDEEEHTVDLKAICKERAQLEKVIKMMEALQKHRASPCSRCPDDMKQ